MNRVCRLLQYGNMLFLLLLFKFFASGFVLWGFGFGFSRRGVGEGWRRKLPISPSCANTTEATLLAGREV